MDASEAQGQDPLPGGLHERCRSRLFIHGGADELSQPSNDLAACEAAYPKVFRAVLAMGATPEDAADALQDAYESALRQSTPISRPESWLFVVAVRRWRRRRWSDRLLRPLEHASSGHVARPPNGDAIDLIAELGRLTPRQREVTVARYVLGLTQQETAAALGITAGTVAATTHQATTKLRERLGGRHE